MVSLLFLSSSVCFSDAEKGTTNPDPLVVQAKLPGWQAACEQNDGFACGNLGAVYALGKGVPANPAKALEFYEKACRFGQGMRCTRAGVMLLNGIGAPQSVERAADLFKVGCGILEPDCCVNYYAVTHGKTINAEGETLSMPVGMRGAEAEEKALQNVVQVLTIACVKGVAKACGNLGGIYEEGSATPRDLSRALENYAKACELGEAERCARAGRFVANGAGGASAIKSKAAKFFERFCELKKMETCPLAHRARNGLLIDLTLTEPGKPAAKATTAAFSPSEPLAHSSERKRVEAPKNTPPWARYPITYPVQTEGMVDEIVRLVKGCNMGNARSCGNAGAALVDASGKPKMFPEATRQLFERACGLGRAQRCVDLSRFHANGWGTEVSQERAKAAIKEACRLGHKPSCIPVPEAR